MKKFLTFISAALFVSVAATSCDKKITPVDETKTYAITIATPENGTLSVSDGHNAIASGDKIKAGTNISIVATANTGFVFGQWNVTGVSVTDETGTAAFEMPAGAVTVAVTFEPEPEPLYVEIGGTKWARFNVGAPGTFVAKETDYGMNYQFGKKVGWVGNVPTPSTGLFELPIGDTPGWGTQADANADPFGQGPCPDGYTVPSVAQWEALLAACGMEMVSDDSTTGVVGGIKYTSNDDASKTLFLPFAGVYQSNPMAPPSGAAFDSVGSSCSHWTNDADAAWMGGMPMAQVWTSGSMAQSMPRSFLYSVRCVKTE